MIGYLSALVVLNATLIPATADGATERTYRYWPRFPRPRTVLTVGQVPSMPEAFLLQSASGLAARAALHGANRDMVWYPIGHPAYVEWQRRMLAQTKPRLVELKDVWAIVDRLRLRGIVKGYVLFRQDTYPRAFHERKEYDPSANVATVLAAQLGGVLVAEELETKAKELGLPLLADARGVTEEECFAKWAAKCSDRVLAMLDPKAAHGRAEAIALDAFVLATYGPTLDRALQRLKPDSPILGWGMGDEYRLTEPISRWAAWQSATNWCLNLPVLSTEQIGQTVPTSSVRVRNRHTIWDLQWRDDCHYASFLMTDGDNVQWLMGDFQFGGERSWWNSRARGQFPMGWGTCVADLAQLCPYALQRLVETATPNDDLLLMGGGYYYPDLFGAAREDPNALRLHARRIRGYMAMTGIRVLHLNASKWDSPDAIRAYTILAEEIPELEGILMVQYAPYTAGKGRVIWVKRRDGTEMPVVAARFAIWAHSPFPDDGPPAEVAKRLDAMSPVGHDASEMGFSWVTVHCWSWFQDVPDPAAEDAEEVDQTKARELGAKRGLEPVGWCIRRLEPHVQVVSPTDMVLLMNLRLRPRQTIERALDDLVTRIRQLPPTRRGLANQHTRRARSFLVNGRYREAFQAGQKAAALLPPAP